MIKHSFAISVVTLALAVPLAHAQEDEPQSATTPDKRYVTVAIGPQESESIGSYALRLYSNSNPEFPADDFVAGVVRPRDGSLLPIEWHDITGDGREEMIVTTESVGTGSDLSADAFNLGKTDISLVASVSDLDPHANVVDALKKAVK